MYLLPFKMEKCHLQALAHLISMQIFLFTSNTALHDRGPPDHSHDMTTRPPDFVYNDYGPD